MQPLRYQGIQVTLTNFFVSQNTTDNRIGANLVITKNPITSLFFFMYAVMIVALAGFTFLSWCSKAVAVDNHRENTVFEPNF